MTTLADRSGPRASTYHVSNRDGSHDFDAREEALEFAAGLAAHGWIGDTVRVSEQPRYGTGEPAGEAVVIWERTRA